MKIQEIQVVFNCLDGTNELSRSDTIEGIQRPDQPSNIQLSRLMFEGGYMLQIDNEVTVIQKNEFIITYLNSEPSYLVIHGDCSDPEPAEFEGTVMELLSQYHCPVTWDELVKMRVQRMKILLHLKPFA